MAEVRIPMADGVELAATLYLPDPALGPQPCVLEALPYRKDDLTSSYAETYVALCEDHHYAVCRLDLRGTGSSAGDATDEYPTSEQSDLVAVIGWLAEQEWCDGSIGMWGTSYSGFNSLQVACERPPALKAICAIYATDDRWTDDVHWRGGALRLVDLVDYCHYMTAMNVLPPVPAVWRGADGTDWRAEWHRRLETAEPWVLTWLREHRDGPYWRHGSVRADATGAGYDRIQCAVMLVAGWADGYRNNSFRTVAALREAGVSHRLLAGPWAHADPAHAAPGPRVDLAAEIVAWWDRWLRGRHDPGAGDDTGGVDVFVRTSTVPEPDLEDHRGWWLSDSWPSPATRWESSQFTGEPLALHVRPDLGTAAWIDCAGHLPWGQSTDQRHDDADSLTWDLEPPGGPIVGQPRVRLRLRTDRPAASLSVKLCDVFPDGTSALITRGTLDLAFRDGLLVPASPRPLTPGEVVEVGLDLDACAYELDDGHRLRVSVAGADWPNTVAPPHPVTLTIHHGELSLPTWHGDRSRPPALRPGATGSSEDPDGVVWSVTHDVLRRTTTCEIGSSEAYETPHAGHATECYAGTVTVDHRSFAQHAHAECAFTLDWPGVAVSVSSTMDVAVGPDAYDVEITTTAHDGDERISVRRWSQRLPR